MFKFSFVCLQYFVVFWQYLVFVSIFQYFFSILVCLQYFLQFLSILSFFVFCNIFVLFFCIWVFFQYSELFLKYALLFWSSAFVLLYFCMFVSLPFFYNSSASSEFFRILSFLYSLALFYHCIAQYNTLQHSQCYIISNVYISAILMLLLVLLVLFQHAPVFSSLFRSTLLPRFLTWFRCATPCSLSHSQLLLVSLPSSAVGASAISGYAAAFTTTRLPLRRRGGRRRSPACSAEVAAGSPSKYAQKYTKNILKNVLKNIHKIYSKIYSKYTQNILKNILRNIFNIYSEIYSEI